MHPDQLRRPEGSGAIPLNLSRKPSPQLERYIVRAKWPYRDGLDPYSVKGTLDWHNVSQIGRWDIEKIIRDFGEFLRHSRRTARLSWRESVFILSDDLFFSFSASMGGERELDIWATSREKADRELEYLSSCYLLPERKVAEVDAFFVLTVCGGLVDARRVTVQPFYFSGDELELHYGAEFCDWSGSFLAKLSESKTGLSILQGSPGTGKTSFLRHLVHQLRGSHRFYYLPVTVYPLLAAPATVDFWLSQNEYHANRQKVVIIEDAETLLMQRALDNHDSLSNLLNIADGFLGSFLNLQIICTINSPIEKMDPAIMRPGRLLAKYTFNRLSFEQGQRLAKAKGLTISVQKSYSLAEVYHDKESCGDVTRLAGFSQK
jgi:ATPase family associated with various cellular activities (AAA)